VQCLPGEMKVFLSLVVRRQSWQAQTGPSRNLRGDEYSRRGLDAWRAHAELRRFAFGACPVAYRRL